MRKKRKTRQSETAAVLRAKLTQENNRQAFEKSYYGKLQQQQQRWTRRK